MAKYTPATIAKAITGGVVAAIGAATVSAHGADLSALSIGDWLGVLAAGLAAAGGVFVTPNKSHEPEPAPVPTADVGITAVQQTVQNAIDSATELDRLRQGVSDALDSIPVVGPFAAAAEQLAQQAINAVHLK